MSDYQEKLLKGLCKHKTVEEHDREHMHVRNHKNIMTEFLQRIDLNLDYQIFNSRHFEVVEKLDLTLGKKLGSGSQGAVHLAEIKQKKGAFVAKYNSVLDNPDLARNYLGTMFWEFCMSENLQHENIVQVMYFVREKLDDKFGRPEDRFYLIMELCQGKDMNNYL